MTMRVMEVHRRENVLCSWFAGFWADVRAAHVLKRCLYLVWVVDLAVAVVAAILLVLGAGVQGGQASWVPTALVTGSPPFLLLMCAGWRLRKGDRLQVALVSIVAAVLLFIDTIVAALSAGYANPCFEKASCTAGPTFPYAAMTAATFLFFGSTIVTLIALPALSGLTAWQERKREHRAGGSR